jgi:hypothetical protein
MLRTHYSNNTTILLSERVLVCEFAMVLSAAVTRCRPHHGQVLNWSMCLRVSPPLTGALLLTLLPPPHSLLDRAPRGAIARTSCSVQCTQHQWLVAGWVANRILFVMIRGRSVGSCSGVWIVSRTEYANTQYSTPYCPKEQGIPILPTRFSLTSTMRAPHEPGPLTWECRVGRGKPSTPCHSPGTAAAGAASRGPPP